MKCSISGFVCLPCRLWTSLLLLQITLSCGMGGGSWWNDRRTEGANRRSLWNCRSWMIAGKRNGHERVTWRIWSFHDSSMCIRSLSSSPTIYCGLLERSHTAISTRISQCTNCDEMWNWFHELWMESVVVRDCHWIWLSLKDNHYFKDLSIFDHHLTLDQISDIHRLHWNQ